MKRTGTLVHIRQLCCLGVSGESLMPALLRSVREFVDADSAGFFWVDAHGEMTNLYAERMLPPKLMRLYFERHYDGPEHPFRGEFLKRAKSSDTVTITTPSQELLQTSYYNEILRHLDAHHVMYAVIRDQGDALGQLSLYRPRNAPAFGPAERTALKSITRYVAHAVSRPSLSIADGEGIGEQYVESDQEGLVVVDGQGQIVQGTAQALNLLSMATQAQFNRATPPLANGDAAPDTVKMLLARLQTVIKGGESLPPREGCETNWGRFTLSAYALSDEPGGEIGLAAIQVRRQERLLVKLAQAMHGLSLPPQQREVALLIAQGKSNQEIAQVLNVSPNTASYHIKQLFLRLDAHERTEALQKILAG
jgi:DNA-binding NarL/FixJ family response regulator